MCREKLNLGALAGATEARDIAKAVRAGEVEDNRTAANRKGSPVIVEAPGGPLTLTIKGRELWALRELIRAGSRGVTPVERVGPRWSHYVFKLRG